MKSILSILFFLFSLQSFSQTIINDKNAEVRNVGSFSGIKVSGGIDVYLSQSNDYALAVSASDEKYRNQIRTEVKNGILNISFDPGTIRFGSDKKLRAYVSFKTLESLDASGACNFIINGIYKGNSAKIKLSGACNIKGNIDFDNLQLDLSGASTVKVTGSADNIKIDASGASDIKNYDLVVNNCVADISGASDVKITVNKSISAKASGASSLFYRGNPERKDVSSSGASSISQKD
ncbi:MAG TPA: head GIN domain-containing protein [Hanamia sp.]|nr:head GIN domain-containing protein [Hanamia sp.]